MTASEFYPGDGYRLLCDGEIIQREDEFWNAHESSWQHTGTIWIGDPYDKTSFKTMRRKADVADTQKDVLTIAIPLKEWQRMNQSIGYLEGVWLGIKEQFQQATQESIDKRYAEICGEDNP